MKRIIFTVINDLTYDQRMHRICSSLADHGFEVLLTGRNLNSSVPLEKKKYEQKRLHLLFSKGKLFYLEYNFRLFFFLLFKKFDVVCGIDLDTILPCYFVSKLKSGKCVYDAHELFPEVPEVVNRPFTRNVWLRTERFSVRRIKNCYTVSEGLAGYFKKKYDNSFSVIRNVPLLENISFLNEETGGEKFIFYQGALNDGRGLPELIAAAKQIPVKLKLAGEGDLSEQLRSIVISDKLTDKIEFLGWRKPEELIQTTRHAFIGLNLLENKGLSYYYSLANKFFDYVHAGVPVITMNFPEYKNLNDQFEVALLIDDLNELTIINAINRLNSDKEFYFRLQKNCIRARSEWNWQKEEAKLLSFYQQLQ